MPMISWEKKFSVNISELDSQHQKLFQLLNTLYDAMKSGTAKETTMLILKDLIAYTDYHFKAEETLFEKYNYPDKINHIKIHNDFKKKVLDFGDKYEKGQSSLTIELFNFLTDWLFSHILNMDKKYESFLSLKLNK